MQTLREAEDIQSLRTALSVARPLVYALEDLRDAVFNGEEQLRRLQDEAARARHELQRKRLFHGSLVATLVAVVAILMSVWIAPRAPAGLGHATGMLLAESTADPLRGHSEEALLSKVRDRQEQADELFVSLEATVTPEKRSDVGGLLEVAESNAGEVTESEAGEVAESKVGESLHEPVISEVADVPEVAEDKVGEATESDLGVAPNVAGNDAGELLLDRVESDGDAGESPDLSEERRSRLKELRDYLKDGLLTEHNYLLREREITLEI